ncbi:MAG TPA: hypothetical protein VLL27_08865 [Solirubrobacterales bacterium]|nr:hypothetical protein [Solirubrobacterales bacterium]
MHRTLTESAPAPYEFIPNVKTSRGTQTVLLDGLYRARNREGSDVILSLKVVRQARSMRTLARTRADEMLGEIARYRELTSRAAKGWLLLVLPDEVEPPEIEERRQLEDRLNQTLVGLAFASVVHETELDSLPQRFDQIFYNDRD